MFKLKKILNLIDKGIIETREELELFKDYATLEISRDDFTYIDVQFVLQDKLIYINISDIWDEDENSYDIDFLNVVEKYLPLTIQNPEDISSSEFYEKAEEIIKEKVKKHFIYSYCNSVWYELYMDEYGDFFTKEGVGNQMSGDVCNVVFINKEDNQFGHTGVEICYQDYLEYNQLNDMEENFDMFLEEYIQSEEFGNYLDAIIDRFYEALEE